MVEALCIFCIIYFFLVSAILYSVKVFSKTEKGKLPLVLQYQISHSRNVDQISLIFKEELYLVTNTSSFQTSQPVRLGVFKLAMNPELFQLKKQIQKHYTRLNQTISILDYMDIGDAIQMSHQSSAVLLKINDEEVDHFDIGFRPLMDIINHIWEKTVAM